MATTKVRDNPAAKQGRDRNGGSTPHGNTRKRGTPARTGRQQPPGAGQAGDQAQAILQELQEAEERLRQTLRQAQQAKDELHQAQQTLQAVRHECAELMRQVEEARQSAQAFHDQSQRAREDYHETERALRAARQELQAVQQQAHQALEEFQQAEQHLADARTESQAVRQQLQEAEHDLQAVRQHAEQARKDSEEAKSALREAAQALGTAQEQSGQAKREMEEAGQRLREARQQVQRVKEDFHATHQELQATRAELYQAQREIQEAGQVAELGRQTVRPDAREPRVPHGQPPEPRQATAAGGPSPEAETLVRETPPTEAERDRLVRHLNDAWAVEKALADALHTMAEEVTDPALRSFLEEHRRVTHRQRQGVEARLRALGKEPTGGQGFFDKMLARIWDALQRPQDDYDKTRHDLLKAFGAAHFGTALYQALGSYARAVGDGETARLAQEHLRQEQEAADRLRPFIGPLSAQAAGAPAPQ